MNYSTTVTRKVYDIPAIPSLVYVVYEKPKPQPKAKQKADKVANAGASLEEAKEAGVQRRRNVIHTEH